MFEIHAIMDGMSDYGFMTCNSMFEIRRGQGPTRQNLMTPACNSMFEIPMAESRAGSLTV